MSRAKGTYTVLENWVLEVAPTLPGVAGWVLLRLAAQANYKRPTMTNGQLMDALGYDARTLGKACVFLAQKGYVLSANGEHVLCKPCTSSAHALHTPCASLANQVPSDTAKTQIYSGITEHKKKEVEERELKEKEPATPAVEPALPELSAQEPTAPGQKNDPDDFQEPTALEPATPEPVTLTEGLPDGKAADAAKNTPEPSQDFEKVPSEAVKNSATSKKNVPGGGAAAVENSVDNSRNSVPTEHQQMFGVLAATCYGGLDGLTAEARGRLNKAAKSLLQADYHPADVTAIAVWLRATESWRTGSLAPQTIAEYAPRWRNAVRPAESTGRTIRMPAVSTFSPDSPLNRRKAK